MVRGLGLGACLLAAACQPPAELARAALQEAPVVPVPAPPLEPRVAVLPPARVEVPRIAPVLTLAAVETSRITPADRMSASSPAVGAAAVAAETAAEASAGTARAAEAQPAVAAVGADDTDAALAALAAADAPGDATQPAVEMLGERVEPGTFARLTWAATETFTGNIIPSAVLMANGTAPGPTLCLTAAIHGDELNGIETVRRVLHDVDPERLSGVLVGVPIVNLQGFHRGSRYLPDRRDLNRFFPGNPTGSAASRIAHSLFHQVIRHCDALVDLHTGSFHRTNLPQLRANLNHEAVVELTQGFGATVVLHSEGAAGTLRDAATDAGIPAVTLEAGMPLQVQEDAVKHSVKALFTLLDTLGMYDRRSLWGNPEPIYYQSRWVRADHGGILAGQVRLGRRVQPGDLLGTVTDPISNEQNDILSPYRGRVIGMALDQFVMPGYATFHIGIEAEVAAATEAPLEDDVDHAHDDYEASLEEED